MIIIHMHWIIYLIPQYNNSQLDAIEITEYSKVKLLRMLENFLKRNGEDTNLEIKKVVNFQ